MAEGEPAIPQVATQDAWLAQRKALLAKEKALTKAQDALNAERRRLPMVRVDKEYVFDGPDGKVTLAGLFDGKKQLIVYHFMFDPADAAGCPGCTGYINAIGDLSYLKERDTAFVIVSRAPLPKLQAYKAAHGWTIPWYSSFGSDFNYDYHVTLDESVAPLEYNYKDKAELEATSGVGKVNGEMPGASVFFKVGDDIFHTYSTYARGGEYLTSATTLLDITPYGRQEDFEVSPPGWPQRPTYG